MLPKGPLSFERYSQIKRYLLFSIASPGLQRKHWWQKLEPLSSHFRAYSQALCRPSTHISTYEGAFMFARRSIHTVRIPSKPIPCGCRILATCGNGYTLDCMYTLLVDSFAGLKKYHRDLSPISSATLQLFRSSTHGFDVPSLWTTPSLPFRCFAYEWRCRAD